MIRGTLKRALAGVLAGLIVVSSVSSGVFADENNPAEPYPMLEAVRGSLDPDEIVTAEDLTLPYGTGFDAGSDLTGITIPDPGKVRVSFAEAKDDSGVDLMTDRAGTYHAKYHVDVMSGHPSYSIMRNITVELFKPPVHEENAATAALTAAETSEEIPSDESISENEEEEGADDDSDIPGALSREEESEDTAPAEEEAAGTTSEETVQDAPEGTESEVSPAESEEETPVKEAEGVSEASKGAEVTDEQEDDSMASEEEDTKESVEEADSEVAENSAGEESEAKTEEVLTEDLNLINRSGTSAKEMAAIEKSLNDGSMTLLTADAALVGAGTVNVTVGQQLWYPPQLGTHGTHMYYVNGKVAYCLEASKESPADGAYAASVLNGNENLQKVLYYGYGGPGDMTAAILPSTFNADLKYIFTHIAASYEYSGDVYGSSRQQLEECGVLFWIEKLESMPAPPSGEMSFSVESGENTLDGGLQKTPRIHFNADSRNEVSFAVPGDVTFVNETTGSSQKGGTAKVKGGEVFRLKAPADKTGSWSSGNLKGSIGEIWRAIVMSTGGVTQVIGAYETQPAGTASFSVKWKAFSTYIEITKKDAADGSPVKGAVYGVYAEKECKTLIMKLGPTDANGYAKSGSIPAMYSKVYVKEMSAPAGYVMEKEPHEAALTAGKTATVDVRETPIGVEISKTDITTGVEIVGAKLTVTDSDGKTVAEWTTDGKPHMIRKLAPGEYTLKEVQAPTADGYVHAEDVKFTVQETGEIQKVEMKDDYTKVRISKTDIVTGKEIEGAKLTILDSEGKEVISWTSGNSSKEIDYLPVGEYTLREVQAPTGSGYVHAEDVKFTVRETGEIQKVEMKDGFTKVLISKTDITTGEEIEGASLRIVDQGGNTVEEWVSDGKTREFERLPAGEYTLIEVQAPTESGYVHAEDVKFTVRETGEIQKVEMKDDYTKVRISKTDIVTGKAVEGAKLTILDSDGKVVASWTSGRSSKEIDYLPVGEYTLREVQAPTGSGYVHAEDVKFTVRETGEIQKVEMKDGFTKVLISKTDITTGEEIEGASLRIVDQDGNTVEEWVTDGKAREFERLPAGEYTLIEVQAPTESGYIHAEDVRFTVEETGEIQKVEMKDDYTKVRISKTDITSGKEVIGATLTILDSDGNAVEEWVTDGSPKEIDYLPVGEYTLREVQAPTESGYIHAEDVRFTVEEIGEIQKVEMKDDYTKVRISKKDIVTGKCVEGATLTILDSEGNEVTSWTSDRSSKEIDYLPVGEYTLREVQAPTADGYVHAEDVRFTVEETGEIQMVEMKDDYTKLSVLKLDAENAEIPVNGAILQLLRKDGTVYEEWTTDGRPHTIDHLPVGSYVLREKSAPRGMLPAADIAVEIGESPEPVAVTMYDRRQKGRIAVVKTDKTTGAALAGAVFEVRNLNTGEVVANLTTDSSGYAETGELPVGLFTAEGLRELYNYEVRETKAPAGYEVTKETAKVTFEPDGSSEVLLVRVKVLDRKTPGGPSEPPTRGPGPKTGDETKVLLPVMTAVMALIVLIAAARRKRG